MKNQNDFSFIITLGALTDGASTLIPILVTGSWVKGGREIDFGKEDLEQAVANFEKLASSDLNVDYDHACEDLKRAAGDATPSAGRITRLCPPERFTIPSGPRKGEEVWMLKGAYQPTDRARQLIRNREYRYVSAAFAKEYPDRASGESQGLTLTSVALTNQPFLDELPEIWLSVAQVPLSGPAAVSQGRTAGLESEPRATNTNRLTSAEIEGGNVMALSIKHSLAADGSHVHEVYDGEKKMGEIPHGQFCNYAAAHGHLSVADVVKSETLNKDLSAHFVTTFAKSVGCEGKSAEEIRGLVALATNPPKAEVTLLCETIGADGKFDTVKFNAGCDSNLITRGAERRGRDAEQRVGKALLSGHLTPAMIATGAPLRLALSDADAFKVLVDEAPARVKLDAVVGIGGTGAETGESPSQLFSRLVEQKKTHLMSSEKISEMEAHRKAGALVAKENPELLKNYRAAVPAGA